MSILRRFLGVFVLIPFFAALTLCPGGENEKYQGEDFDVYSCVQLHELQRVPTSYKNAKVHFLARFHRAENLWAPFYTPFLPEDFLSFSCWEPSKRLWVKEEHLQDFPFLYIRKDSPDMQLITQAPPYQVMELYSVVRNDFNNIPWIEVIHVVPCKEPLLHDELLHHMICGLDAVAAGRFEEAVGHLTESLHHDPPLDAAIDIHIGLAKAFMGLRCWNDAACHAHAALDLCPHHDDARAIWQAANSMMAKVVPAPPQPAPPTPPPQPGPKAGSPKAPAPAPSAAATPTATPQPAPHSEPEQPKYAPQQPPQGGLVPPDEMKDLPAPPKAAPVLEPIVAPFVAPSRAPEVSERPWVSPAAMVVPTPPNDAVPATPAQAVPAVAPAPDGVREYAQRMQDLQKDLDAARIETQRQAAALRDEEDGLRRSLDAKQAELEKQVRVSVDLEGRLREALARLETSAKDVAAADARAKQAEAELEEARKGSGDATVAALTQKVKALEQENATLRRQVDELTARNVELEKTVQSLTAQLCAAKAAPGGEDAATGPAVRAAKQVESLLAEKADLGTRIQTIGSERDGLASQVKDREDRIRSMQVRIQELEQLVKASLAGGVPGMVASADSAPPKPRGRWVGFDCRPAEEVKEEIRRYREWLQRQEKKPGAVENAMQVEPELLEPAMSRAATR